MDGLVLDTEPTYRFAWQSAAKTMGVALSDEFCHQLSGCQGDDVERKFREQMGSMENLAIFRRLSTADWWAHVQEKGIAVKPGLLNLLGTLVRLNVPYCLATNSTRRNAINCLKLAGLEDAFSIIVSRDDVKRGKPWPDIYVQAAGFLEQQPQCCLAVEDSSIGITSASRAGTVPILIGDSGVQLEQARPLAYLVLDSLDVLDKMITGASLIR